MSVDNTMELSEPALPATIVRLLDDHKRLDTVFDCVEQHLHACTVFEPATLDLLACLVDYIVEYPERVHHPREDLITEALVDKGLTPWERTLVELTVSQHADLGAWTASIAREVSRLLAREPQADERFSNDFRQYLELQRQHMRREERQLFPLAVRMLSPEDWQKIEQGDDRTADPIFAARLDRYQSLYELTNLPAATDGVDKG